VNEINDSNTNIAYLKEKVKQFCKERDWDQFHNPKDLAIGISTEAGELLDIFRFKSNDEIIQMMNDPERREAIGDELSDVLFFVLRFAQMNNFDLSDQLARKIEKNNERYPINKSRNSNKKYNEI
jgi:NTP pyrophosphatase (non-canonical NTP hydrolase)